MRELVRAITSSRSSAQSLARFRFSTTLFRDIDGQFACFEGDQKMAYNRPPGSASLYKSPHFFGAPLRGSLFFTFAHLASTQFQKCATSGAAFKYGTAARPTKCTHMLATFHCQCSSDSFPKRKNHL